MPRCLRRTPLIAGAMLCCISVYWIHTVLKEKETLGADVHDDEQGQPMVVKPGEVIRYDVNITKEGEIDHTEKVLSITGILPKNSSLTEAMKILAVNNTLFLSTLEVTYISMAHNLYLTSYKHFQIRNYLYVATDNEACPVLLSLGINCIQHMTIMSSGGTSVYGSREFNIRCAARAGIILVGLRLGLSVTLVDLDIVFFQDPRPYLHCGDCDILFQPEVGRKEMNAGMYMMNPTQAAIALQERAMELMTKEWNHLKGDQFYYNVILKRMRKERKIKDKSLDAAKFLNGFHYVETGKRMFAGDKACDGCVLIHNTFLTSLEAKRYRFREFGMWFVDEDGYYSNPDTKYIQYQNPNSAGSGDLSVSTVEIEALKTAFILGYALNRTVILPKFHCQGVIGYKPTPGQWCNLAALYKMKIFENGTTDYRENVFLNQPLVPEGVKNSLSEIYLITGPSSKPNHTMVPEDVHILTAQSKSITLEEILTWFATESSSVLRFHSLYNKIRIKGHKLEEYLARITVNIQHGDIHNT